MSEQRVLSYLSNELTDAERQTFEKDLASDPALREELDQWHALAGARQLEHNELGRADREVAFLRMLDTLDAPAPVADERAHTAPTRRTPIRPTLWRRARQWLWPSPASPLLPLGWALALVMSFLVLQPMRDDVISDGMLTRGSDTGCPRLAVDLPDTVTTKQLRDTLVQYDASIVSGPDADGRFLLTATRESSLRDAANALGALTTTPAPGGACPSK